MEKLVLTRDQVRQIDKAAIDDYAMPGVILMENAGRNATQLIIAELARIGGKTVAIFCGAGNNGGDGFVIARHLHNAAYDVRISLAVDAGKLKGDAEINYRIVRNTPVPIEGVSAADRLAGEADLIVDALLGTGFSGQVRPPMDQLIDAINRARKFVVAVDVPSGLDCATGQPSQPAVKADLTVTFVAIKSGMLAESAKPYVGRIEIADIGVPRELIEKVAGR